MEEEALRIEFDLFRAPPLQRMVKNFKYEETFTGNNVKTDGTLTFRVKGSANQWIDLDDTYLLVRYKVVTHNEQKIANQAETIVKTFEEPNLLHNLWSQVEMAIQNVTIKSVVNPYPMRAYIENLLTTTPDGLQEMYESEGFWKEGGGTKFDHAIQETAANIATNTPLRKKPQTLNKDSVERTLYGKLATDLWRQGRNIPPSHDLKLTLTKNRPQFYLRSSEVAGQEHKLQLEKVILVVKRVELYDDTQASLDKAMLEAGKIIYPIRRVDVKSHTIATGTKIFQESIVSGQMPYRIILGFVDSDAYSGSYAKSPFNFKHYNIEELYLQCHGDMYPSNRYITSFNNRDALVPWLNLKRLVTAGHPFFNHTISYESYCNGGYTLWVVDLSQDNKCGQIMDYNNIKLDGDVRIHVRFGGEGLANPVNLVMYAEFENLVEVDRNKALMVDY